MSLRIKINNLNRKRRIPSEAIKKVARKALSSFKEKNALIDITFVTDRKMNLMNRRYMGRKGSTDVLSFLLNETPPKGRCLIGDIYISSDTAHKNTVRFNTDFRQELFLYTIHGILHLLGFGDKTTKEKNKIRILEQKLLARVI